MLHPLDLVDPGFQDEQTAEPIIEIHHVLCRNWINHYSKEVLNQNKLNDRDYVPSLMDT